MCSNKSSKRGEDAIQTTFRHAGVGGGALQRIWAAPLSLHRREQRHSRWVTGRTAAHYTWTRLTAQDAEDCGAAYESEMV